MKKQTTQIREMASEANLKAINTAPKTASKIAPATSGQQRLWYQCEMLNPAYSYNEQLEIKIYGKLDIIVLKEIIDRVVQEHEILRTVFKLSPENQLQQIIKPAFSVALPVINVGNLSTTEKQLERLINDHCLEQGQALYNLAEGPLFRVAVLQLPNDQQLFLCSFHHIIMDGRAAIILLKEINQLYNSGCKKQPCDSAKRFQMADYVVAESQRLQSDLLQRQVKHWTEQLQDMPPLLELPTDYPRQTTAGYFGAWQAVAISEKLTSSLLATSWKQRVSPFIVIMAAYKSLLMHYSGQQDIVVGTIFANRPHLNTSNLIGFLAETALLRSKVTPQMLFSDLLRDLEALCSDALYKRPVPFALLMDSLRKTGALAADANPIQAALVFDSIALEDHMLAGQRSDPATSRSMEVTKFDLTLSLEIIDGQLKGHFEYSTALFDAATIKRMAEHFQTLLSSVVKNPKQPIGDLPLLSRKEHTTVLKDWNKTRIKYPANLTIHQLFDQQAITQPSTIALICGTHRISYHQLNALTNQLANYLVAQGVTQDSPVGLYMHRSGDMIIALLAILKAGGYYIPIDPNSPRQRINYQLSNSHIELLLTESGLNTSDFENSSIDCLCLDSQWYKVEAQPFTKPSIASTPEQLAYVNYTSGSTGLPKAVGIPHKGVVRLSKNNQYQRLHSSKRTLHASSIAFDAATFEIWSALLNGGTLVLYPDETLSPRRLEQLIVEQHIDTVFLTTSLFHMLVDEHPKALETVPLVLTGGEALSLEHIKIACRHCPNTQFVNVYGPTENTTFTTYHAIDNNRLGSNGCAHYLSVPIGRPVSNTTTYILDTQCRPVPIGVIGELHIGGDGLARNYLDRPALSAEKFIPDPFSLTPGQRMYKSGDLARYSVTGEIEFCGRVDDQVKIRGYRIELGEVEAAITGLPQVRESLVLTHSRDASGSNHFLTAYVAGQKDIVIDSHLLRSQLQAILPHYMVPALFIILDKLPLNSNGKVNRKALPEPDLNALQPSQYSPPSNPTEDKLVAIWATILALPENHISTEHDFFELGGNSISVMRMLSLCHKQELELSAKQVFEQRTIARLSQSIATTATPKVGTTKLLTEICLDSSIQLNDLPWSSMRNPSAILLTGCSGFVGAFLLKELLSQTDVQIYCLIRADSVSHGTRRIRQKLKQYNLYNEQFDERISPILGDLSQPRFGLNQTDFNSLASKVDSIIHSGAWVNHVYPYDMLKAANVDGTREVLRLATTEKIKSVHHISILNTGSVSENDFERLANGGDYGYALSKYAAEKMIDLASEKGIPISVHRLGMVSGDQQGASNTHDRICLLIKGCIELNAIPNSAGLALICSPTLTPVDFVAKAIVTLCKHSNHLDQHFDIVSPQPMVWSELIAALVEFGYGVEILPIAQWQDKLTQQANKNPDSKILETLSGLYIDEPSSLQESCFSEEFNFDKGYLPMLDTLYNADVQCGSINRETIKRYLGYLVEEGFVAKPEGRPHGLLAMNN